jgi:hypothetical protein
MRSGERCMFFAVVGIRREKPPIPHQNRQYRALLPDERLYRPICPGIALLVKQYQGRVLSIRALLTQICLEPADLLLSTVELVSEVQLLQAIRGGPEAVAHGGKFQQLGRHLAVDHLQMEVFHLGDR